MKAFWVSKQLGFASAITSNGHVKKLQAAGVTHVINLRHSKHGKKIRKFKSLWLPFKDDMKPRPEWFYHDALKFYQDAMQHPKSRVLAMCHHGICRSASLTYFLLRTEGFTPSRAKLAVRTSRRYARVIPAYQESSEEFLARFLMKNPSGKHSNS
jgi:protein-tyrosine phosphatase